MAQGMRHSHNRKKYLQRLYVSSVFMSVGNMVFNAVIQAINVDHFSRVDNNIFATLFACAFLICLIEYSKERPEKSRRLWAFYLIWQVAGLILPDLFHLPPSVSPIMYAVFGNIFMAEGGFFYVIMGPLFDYTLKDRKKLVFYYTLLSAIPFLNAATGFLGKISCLRIFGSPFTVQWLTGIHVWGTWAVQPWNWPYIFGENFQWMVIGALPIILLYNGEKGNGRKYFYYLFYPIHIYLLAFIGVMMG